MKKDLLGRLGVPVLAAFMLLAGGCSDDFSADGSLAGPPGGMGATPGGVQDMGFARELVENGRVPPAEAFTVEGMFSEHDLPLDGDPPADVLTLRGAAGYAPDHAGDPCGWLQVGMSSSIEPDAFVRGSLSVIACVDVSGSMGWTYGADDQYPTPGAVSRRLLNAVAGELGLADRCGIVVYSHTVQTVLPMVAGDSPLIAEAIAGLSAGGVTNMEAGLRRAFALGREEFDAGTDAVRVMLFTDIQPNTGATSPGSFRELAEAAANDGIGLTVFGLGVGMRQEVMNAITDLRGGNAFSLFDLDDVDALMEDSWPWMVSPIAHGLTMALSLPADLAVAATYGFPGDTPELDVASVFLSRRKGALLVQLRPTGDVFPAGAVVDGELSYTALDGSAVNQSLQWTLQDAGDGAWFEQPTVGRTVALALLVDGMKAAAEVYGEDPEAAIARMEAVCARIDQDVDDLQDAALEPERDLAGAILQLMIEGAPQGDMYGQ